MFQVDNQLSERIQKDRGYISFSEIPSLDHEILYNAVEGAAFVTVSFLSCISKLVYLQDITHKRKEKEE